MAEIETWNKSQSWIGLSVNPNFESLSTQIPGVPIQILIKLSLTKTKYNQGTKERARRSANVAGKGISFFDPG